MNQDPYIALLCELIRMRPVSSNIEAVNRVQQRVCDFLTERGIYCSMEMNNDRKVLFASTSSEKTPDVLLCTHLDVVPAEDESQFEPEIKGNLLYGRGSTDCLGNSIVAIRTLCEYKDKISIGCIFCGDEEIGGLTAAAMIERGYGAKNFALILDSGRNIYYAHKGILCLKVTAEGHGGHSSQPWNFENPVLALINGLHALFADWKNPTKNDTWHLSIAPTILQAGNAVNRIPDTAEAILNIRVIKKTEIEEITSLIREKTGLKVEILEQSDPFESSADSELLRRLKTAYEHAFGVTIEPAKMMGATDARHLYKIGCPLYITGVSGNGIHGREEYVELDSLDKLFAVLTELLIG
ncbi:MAG: M20 family metallopeptidase [Lentisphaeria bacterium]|nr:M20 family metallopeptidase [Lentisphaeria bacterium]